MGYNKLIKYGNYVDLYEYEEDIKHNGRERRAVKSPFSLQNVGKDRQDIQTPPESKEKRQDNARRSALHFRRIVSSNMEESANPLLITLTHSENLTEVGLAHRNFNAFARSMRAQFGNDIRYIAVLEFQKRGSIHFHALFWGLPTEELARTERHTRMVATLWGQGFVDLVATDGDIKIAGYLSKYMVKAFLDPKLGSKKAFICSRNIKRPTIIKNTLITPLFFGGLQLDIDLSEAEMLREKQYMTQWLGKGRYRQYRLT